MSDREPAEQPWTRRWWRSPGESLLVQDVGNVQVSADLDWCMPTEWGIKVNLPKGAVDVIFNLETADLIQGNDLSSEIMRVLARQLELRRRGVALQPKVRTSPIVRAIAARLFDDEWVSGRWLRSETKLGGDFERALRELLPRYVRREAFDEADSYSLTLPGLLALESAAASREFIDILRRAIFRAFQRNPDATSYSADDLIACGLAREDLSRARLIASISQFVSPHGHDDDDVFPFPRDAEVIAQSVEDKVAFDDFVLRAAKERRKNKNALYAVERPWASAPLSLERDGSQTDYTQTPFRIPRGDRAGTNQPARSRSPVAEAVSLGEPPRILKHLGSGAEADVYLVRDRFGREVAAKVFYESKRIPEHIYAHAVGLARVPHPAVAALYSIDEVTDPDGRLVPAIFMERLVGEGLDDRLQRQISFQEAIEWGRTILEACAAIDAAGHFHPDPHAGNFIVTDGGLRMYDVLYSLSAEQWSTVKKDALRARTARTIRGLIEQLLDKLPFSDEVLAARREFTARTRGVDPTLAEIRAAFGDVMEKLRAARHF